MSDDSKISKLQESLGNLGVRSSVNLEPLALDGYPLTIPFPDGGQIIVDLPSPALIGQLDPKLVGIALVDAFGRVWKTWGLADPLLDANLRDSPLHGLIEGDSESGGCLYLDKRRYFTGRTRDGERVLLVCQAVEEFEARASSEVNAQSAELFRRIGKALSMQGSLDELAAMTVHEIARVCGFAAVLLWTHQPEGNNLILRARIGVNRQGTRALQVLEPSAQLSCAAELVAARQSTLAIPNVHEHLMTSQLEARCCFLPVKSMIAMPLIVAERLIGVLELIGREDDTDFEASHESFLTLAEHVGLALNTAMSLEHAERLASFDPMTGVANHRTLQDFVLAQINQAERSGSALGLLMIDVDHFRSFNEEEGHDAGDSVLKEVAQKIFETLRTYDLTARYGGEEFSAVLPGLDLDRSTEVAERIRESVESIQFTSATGNERHVTVSIGVACYPETARDATSLFKAADTALFRAKRAGRNRTVRFEGPYSETPKEPENDRVWLEKWQTVEDAALSATLWSALETIFHPVVSALRLSQSQIQILERLIWVFPTYRRLMALNDREIERQIELAAEFRPLLPSLLTMNERYDGTGPRQLRGEKIPLLARILSVLVALADEKGEPLARDPVRFDARISELVLDISEAA